MNEIWLNCPGFPCYEISESGNVRNKNTHKIKALWVHTGRNGYQCLRVTLYRSGRKSNPRVHRLVCEAFHENPCNKPEVNHIDHNSFNNHRNNVEWATRAENELHKLNKHADEYEAF